MLVGQKKAIAQSGRADEAALDQAAGVACRGSAEKRDSVGRLPASQRAASHPTTAFLEPPFPVAAERAAHVGG